MCTLNLSHLLYDTVCFQQNINNEISPESLLTSELISCKIRFAASFHN